MSSLTSTTIRRKEPAGSLHRPQGQMPAQTQAPAAPQAWPQTQTQPPQQQPRHHLATPPQAQGADDGAGAWAQPRQPDASRWQAPAAPHRPVAPAPGMGTAPGAGRPPINLPVVPGHEPGRRLDEILEARRAALPPAMRGGLESWRSLGGRPGPSLSKLLPHRPQPVPEGSRHIPRTQLLPAYPYPAANGSGGGDSPIQLTPYRIPHGPVDMDAARQLLPERFPQGPHDYSNLPAVVPAAARPGPQARPDLPEPTTPPPPSQGTLPPQPPQPPPAQPLAAPPSGQQPSAIANHSSSAADLRRTDGQPPSTPPPPQPPAPPRQGRAAYKEQIQLDAARRNGAVVQQGKLVPHPDGRGGKLHEPAFLGSTFTDTPQGPVIRYRDDHGDHHDVSVHDMRRVVGPDGRAHYEFALKDAAPDASGRRQTLRLPEGATPLFTIDPATGLRTGRRADGTPQPLGADRNAAAQAGLAAEENGVQQARLRDLEKIGNLDRQLQAAQTALAPAQQRLQAAQQAMDSLDQGVEQFRQGPGGLVLITRNAAGQEVATPVTDPQAIARGSAQVQQRARTQQELQQAQAAHAPLAAGAQQLQQEAEKMQRLTIADQVRRRKSLAQRRHASVDSPDDPDWKKTARSMAEDPATIERDLALSLEEEGSLDAFPQLKARLAPAPALPGVDPGARLSERQVADLRHAGHEAVKGARTREEADAALTKIGLDPATLRELVTRGHLSPQDGQYFNDKLNGGHASYAERQQGEVAHRKNEDLKQLFDTRQQDTAKRADKEGAAAIRSYLDHNDPQLNAQMQQQAQQLGIPEDALRQRLETLRAHDFSVAYTPEGHKKDNSFFQRFKRAFGFGDELAEPTRKLPDGGILPHPALGKDKAAFDAAIDAAEGTPEAKAKAREMWAQYHDDYLSAARATLETSTSLPWDESYIQWRERMYNGGKVNGRSENQLAEQFMQEQKGRPGHDQFSQILNTKLLSYLTHKVAAQTTGFLGMVTGHIPGAGGLSQTLSEFSAGRDAEYQRATAALPHTTANTTLNKAANIMGDGLPMLGLAALTGGAGPAAILTGVLGAGGTFSELYQHGIDQGLSPEQAHQVATAPAVFSGSLSGVLTRFFPGGKEALATPAAQQVLRETLGGVMKGYMGTLLATTGKAVKGAAVEIPQELLDSGASHIIAEMAKGRTFHEASLSLADQLPDLLAGAAAMGGLGEGGKHLKDTLAAPHPSATAPLIPGTPTDGPAAAQPAPQAANPAPAPAPEPPPLQAAAPAPAAPPPPGQSQPQPQNSAPPAQTQQQPSPSSGSGSDKQPSTTVNNSQPPSTSPAVPAGPPLDAAGSGRLIANLDKVKEKRPLNPREQADYDQAQRIVAENFGQPNPQPDQQPASPGQPSATSSSGGPFIPDNTISSSSTSGGGDGQDPGSPTHTVDHGGEGGGTPSTSGSGTQSSSGSLPPGASSTTTGHAAPNGIDSGHLPSKPPSTSPSAPPLKPQEVHSLLKDHAQNPNAPLTDTQAQRLEQAVRQRAGNIERNLTRKLDVTGWLPPPEARARDHAIDIGRSPPGHATALYNAGPGGRSGPPATHLPGNTRNNPWSDNPSSGGSNDANLVMAGGGSGPKKPLQGGAAAAAPPPAPAGNPLPDAVGQMMNGPGGTANPDSPRASADDDGSGPQSAPQAAGAQQSGSSSSSSKTPFPPKNKRPSAPANTSSGTTGTPSPSAGASAPEMPRKHSSSIEASSIDTTSLLNTFYLNEQDALIKAHQTFGGPEGLLRNAAEAVAAAGTNDIGKGPGESGDHETDALIRFARRSGLMLDGVALRHYMDQNAMKGGVEHRVAHNIPAGRVIKDLDAQALATESIYNYLTDLQLSNALFGDDLRIEGFYQHLGRLHVVTSQSYVNGPHPDWPRLNTGLVSQGLVEAYPRSLSGAFIIPNTAAGDLDVIDLHPNNVIDAKGWLHPIDAHFYFDDFNTRRAALKALGLSPNDAEALEK